MLWQHWEMSALWFPLLLQCGSRLLHRPGDSAGRNAKVVQVLPFQFFLLKDTEALDADFYRLSCFESSDLPRGKGKLAQLTHGTEKAKNLISG